jgi:hypothetical protein
LAHAAPNPSVFFNVRAIIVGGSEEKT